MRRLRTPQPLAVVLPVGAFVLRAVLSLVTLLLLVTMSACGDGSAAPNTGGLSLTMTGLPDGTVASAQLSRGTTQQAVAGTRTVQGLETGEWTVAAIPLTANGTVMVPQPSIQTVSVSNATVSSARIAWVATTGSIAIVASGLPPSVDAALLLTGPGGFSRVVTGPDTIRTLPPGTYQLSARDVRVGASVYRSVPSLQDINVPASLTAVSVSAQYEAAPGAIDVRITGLPNNANAGVVLTAPSGATSTITRTTRVLPAPPGRWRLAASVVRSGGFSYTPTPASVDTVLTTADTLALGVQYVVTTGALAVTVRGLPTGASGAVRVSGPAGFSRTLITSTTYSDLAPGVYTVSADAVPLGGTSYRAAATQTVTVTASTTPVSATVTYATANGTLAFVVSGLPAGVEPSLRVQGPLLYDRVTTASTPLSLPTGQYTVTINPVASGPISLVADPRTIARSVAADGRDTVRIAYRPTTGPINWSLDNAYLTQAVQRSDGSLPLVAARDALLRAFVRADRESTIRPVVRARLFDGTIPVQSVTLTPPPGTTPTSINEGTVGATFNAIIPAALLRPGLRVLVEVDPDTSHVESTRSDNVWPSNGAPQVVTVSSVPVFNVRFVPITASELTGNITDVNATNFLQTARMVWPLADVTFDVRARYTSSVPAFQSTDENRAWTTLLSEINALRVADGAPPTTHYYGVLKVTYTSGVAGYGYVPGRTAIGWDYLPSGDLVAAHEWGHNFNRPHAPCGAAGNPDPSFPNLGGTIGVFGWNRALNTAPAPSTADLMGYCSPSWVSDYSWNRVLSYRQSAGLLASISAAAAVPRDGLLVWGRIADGVTVIEPSFRMRSPVTPASNTPTHVIEALAEDGTVMAALPISADVVDHTVGRDERQFAAVLPWSADLEARVAGIRVRDIRSPLVAALRTTDRSPRPAITPSLTVDAVDAAHQRLTWNQSAFPMLMVRDQRTGQIVSFVRTSGTLLTVGREPLAYVMSDGVRTVVP